MLPGGVLLVLMPGDFVRRLAARVPPPGRHLVHFHGAFASNARVRPAVLARVPKPDVPPVPATPPAQTLPPRQPALPSLPPRSPPSRPRLDCAALLLLTFALDVLTGAPCGGPWPVLAVVTHRDTARPILLAMGLDAEAPPTGPPPPRRKLELAFAS